MARFANVEETREFKDSDGDVLVLRLEVTKGESDYIAELNQNYRLPARGILGLATADDQVEIRSRLKDANRYLFSVLAVKLTVGNLEQRIDPETYDKLDVPTGQWVDECVEEIFRERRRRAEGNESAEATPPSDSPTSPASDEVPTPAS